MNCILFQEPLERCVLPPRDRRAEHIRDVLKMQPGDELDVGVANGPMGKARIVKDDAAGMELSFTWGEVPPSLNPLWMAIGLPRPQTARKILREAASLGIAQLDFVHAGRGDPAYRQSKLWSTDEWQQQLWEGAELAFTTRLSAVRYDQTLAEWLEDLPDDGQRLALDNYEATRPLGVVPLTDLPQIVAIGPERGWSAGDRDALRAANFTLVQTGERVLRTETACVAAVSILSSRIGWW